MLTHNWGSRGALPEAPCNRVSSGSSLMLLIWRDSAWDEAHPEQRREGELSLDKLSRALQPRDDQALQPALKVASKSNDSHLEWMKWKNQTITSVGEKCGDFSILIHCWWEWKMVHIPAVEKRLTVSWLPSNPAALLLGMYPEELETHVSIEVCTRMFIASLFIKVKQAKQPTNWCIDKQKAVFPYNTTPSTLRGMRRF